MVKYNRLEFIKWLNADESRKENLPDWSQNTEEERWESLSSKIFDDDNWEKRMELSVPKLIPYRKVFNKWKIEKDKAIKEQEEEIKEEKKRKSNKAIKENLLLLFAGLLGLFLIYWIIKKKFQE